MGAPMVWARRVVPEGWGPKPRKIGGPKGGGPKISRFFFFPLPPQNSFFSSLSGGLLVEFWWCFEAPGALQCARLEFSGGRVQPRRPQSRRGFTPEHDQTKTLNRETSTHATQHTHTNTTHFTTSQSRFGQTRFGHSRFGLIRFWPKSVLAIVGHTTKKPTLAKVGLAKLGQPKVLAQVCLAKVGHDPGHCTWSVDNLCDAL